MCRRAVVGLFAVLAHVAWPCEDIAVLSTDAKYVLLDGDTLETLDVGDLKWKGVLGIDSVYAGSTSRRLAFGSSRLSGEALYRGDGGLEMVGALIVVTNLAEAGDAPMEMAFSREYDYGRRGVQWIDGTDELLVWQRERSVLSVLDERLQRIDEWRVSSDARRMVACRREGRLFVGGDDIRIVRENGASVAEALAWPEGVERCFLHRLTGCRARVACRGKGRYRNAVVDLTTNRVVSKRRFSPPTAASAADRRTSIRNVALFAGGGRLLQQQWVDTLDPPGRIRPDTLLRVLDPASAEILAENGAVLPGRASRAFCREKGERVVLTGHGRVQLVDLDTLNPIASAAIPFGAREDPFSSIRHFTLPSLGPR